MKKIKLFNRDGADLWLERTDKKVDNNIFVWTLKVDQKHDYVLKYIRIISEDSTNDILAIDPSGGPMLSVGNEFEEKYKIVRINSINNILISEGDYN
jgi:hypothetical protein